MNHSNVEEILLKHESLRQSVRLILLNAYEKNESVIIKVLKILYRTCSTLFKTILSAAEHKSLSWALKNDDDDDDAWIIELDSIHSHVIVTECLVAKYCNEILQVSTRMSDLILMIPTFKSRLRAALTSEYELQNIIHLGYRSLQWCKKVTFTSRWLKSNSPHILPYLTYDSYCLADHPCVVLHWLSTTSFTSTMIR